MAKELTDYQKYTLNLLKQNFKDWFGEIDTWFLPIHRPAFMLETLYKKGFISRKKNPDETMIIEPWLYRVNDNSVVKEEG